MNTLENVVVGTHHGSDDPAAPLVLLFHGRGADESSLVGLAQELPAGPSYLSLRAPVDLQPGYTWFENHGLGRPQPRSLARTMCWFREWLRSYTAPERPVALVGFSGGAAFVAGLVLTDPRRFTAAAMICGTVPWGTGVPTTAQQLAGFPLFCAMGRHDDVMPAELMDRTWRYLERDSGARATMYLDDKGHDITPETVRRLGSWLATVLSGD